MRTSISDKRLEFKFKTTPRKSHAESPSNLIPQSTRNLQSHIVQRSKATSNRTSPAYPIVSSVETVAPPDFVGNIASSKVMTASAKNILEKAMLLANSSLDSLKEIKISKEKAQNEQLREIIELREELEKKNLLIQQLEAGYADGKLNFQKILDDKNSHIRELTGEIKSLRQLVENSDLRGQRLDKQGMYDIRALKKKFNTRLKASKMKLEEIKRTINSTEINVSTLQQATKRQFKHLNEQIKRRSLNSESLISILRKENTDLRKELVQVKAYLAVKDNKVPKTELMNERLKKIESALKEREVKSKQLEQELSKGKTLTDEKSNKFNEERKVNKEQIDLLHKMINELSNFVF